MKKNSYCFCIANFHTNIGKLQPFYPIEIGCLFTDDQLNVINEMDYLIKWNHLLKNSKLNEQLWSRSFINHNIDRHEYISTSNDPYEICKDICDLIDKTKIRTQTDQCILLSNDIVNTYKSMEELFKLTYGINFNGIPFTNAWDVSMLLIPSGIGNSLNNKRAKENCDLVHGRLITAWEWYKFNKR